MTEEDAGWVQTPCTNARTQVGALVNHPAEQLPTASVAGFPQNHLNFTDMIRYSTHTFLVRAHSYSLHSEFLPKNF